MLFNAMHKIIMHMYKIRVVLQVGHKALALRFCINKFKDVLRSATRYMYSPRVR